MRNAFFRFTRYFAAASITCLALTATQVHAADRFAVISISNETSAQINMVYRWGSERSKIQTLRPGAREWFAYQYSRPDQDSSPDFFVTFDADVRNGVRYNESKKLHGFRAPEQNFALGHKYTFRYDGPSKRYIELLDSSR